MQRFAALALAVSLLTGAGTAAIVVQDDLGNRIELAAPPRRVVSLLPSLTETVCALGECARLVGVDRYSTWPAGIAGLPRLGGGLDPDIEGVVALKPDLVLVASSARAAQRLSELGLKVLALEPYSQADTRRVTARVAQALGLPAEAAARLMAGIDAEIDQIARGLPAGARGARVYFEVNRAPYAAGAASFIGETLARLGAVNIVPAALGPFPKLNPEFVVRADPDIIMTSERGGGDMATRPGWVGLRAIRERRVCAFGPAEAEALVHPGPRLPEAARIMAGCLAAKASAAGGRP